MKEVQQTPEPEQPKVTNFDLPQPGEIFITPEKEEKPQASIFDQDADFGLSLPRFAVTPDAENLRSSFKMQLFRCDTWKEVSGQKRRTRHERNSSQKSKDKKRLIDKTSILKHAVRRSLITGKSQTPRVGRTSDQIRNIEESLKEEESFIHDLLQKKLERIHSHN